MSTGKGKNTPRDKAMRQIQRSQRARRSAERTLEKHRKAEASSKGKVRNTGRQKSMNQVRRHLINKNRKKK